MALVTGATLTKNCMNPVVTVVTVRNALVTEMVQIVNAARITIINARMATVSHAFVMTWALVVCSVMRMVNVNVNRGSLEKSVIGVR